VAFGVVVHPPHDNGVKSPVELPVVASVKAVTFTEPNTGGRRSADAGLVVGGGERLA
jgi:hypothetical protein